MHDNLLEPTNRTDLAYDACSRAKIEAALADPRPSVSQTEAMAWIDTTIARAAKRR